MKNRVKYNFKTRKNVASIECENLKKIVYDPNLCI